MADRRKPQRGPKPVSETYLRNAALYYLSRYAASAEKLRRVLTRRVQRAAREQAIDPNEWAATVDRIVGECGAKGFVDDRLYAESRTRTLRARGTSQRLILARLGQDGITDETAEGAVAAVGNDAGGRQAAEREAAITLARRRRLGPFSTRGDRATRRDRDLAALARAGFALSLAREIVDAATAEDLEAPAD